MKLYIIIISPSSFYITLAHFLLPPSPLYKALLMMSHAVMMKPGVVSGTESPYPTVVIVLSNKCSRNRQSTGTR